MASTAQSKARLTSAALAAMGLLLSPLEVASVAAETQLSYVRLLQALLLWLLMAKLPKHWEASTWDEILVDFFEHEYDRGASQATAGKTLAAIRWSMPSIPRPTKIGLPHAHGVWLGWKRLEPQHSREPCPRLVAILAVLWLTRAGRPGFGLIVLLMLETYARPSEAINLRKFQILRPVPGGNGSMAFWSILIKAEELGVPGEIGEFDATAALDLARHSTVVIGLANYHRTLKHDMDPAFPCSFPDLAKSFAMALHALGLTMLQLTLYTLRQGGASTDAALKARSLRAIQERGQWRRDSSVRRYQRHGRFSRVLWRTPSSIRAQEANAESELRRFWKTASTWRDGALTWYPPKSSSTSSQGRVQ